jgi:hypothetical protein
MTLIDTPDMRVTMRLRTRDVPGTLVRIAQVLADTGCNILDIDHHRSMVRPQPRPGAPRHHPCPLAHPHPIDRR